MAKNGKKETKQGLIATQLSVLEALVVKVDENIHPWYYTERKTEYIGLPLYPPQRPPLVK